MNMPLLSLFQHFAAESHFALQMFTFPAMGRGNDIRKAHIRLRIIPRAIRELRFFLAHSQKKGR